MAGYYVKRGESLIGPIDPAKLRQLAAEGRLLRTDLLAKDAAGPWSEAGRTKLFENLPPELPAVQVESPLAVRPPESQQALTSPPSREQLPAVADRPRGAKAVITSAASIGGSLIVGTARGMLLTVRAIGGHLAERSKRRHEIKLAKIRAEAVAAGRPVPPAAMQAPASPVVTQTTIIKIVNRNGGGCGCGGCLTLIILIAVAAYFIVQANSGHR